MKETIFTFKSVDELDIHVYKWEPEANVIKKAAIQIVHGSVEHAKRYKEFASFLVGQGFVVYANDHRGHGITANTVENLSYFSDNEDGFSIAVDDLNILNKIIHKEQEGLKVFILGHSLGSFMTRMYMTKYKEGIDGALLTGTGGGQNALLSFGMILSSRDMKKKGRKYNSIKLHNLMYEPLNKNVANSKSSVDFISRDQNVIDEYNRDPYCGHTVTTEYAYESLKGIKFCNTAKSFSEISKDLPIYILSGQNDLVGGKNSKGVRKVYSRYLDAGSKDVELKIYDNARHEILNEVNKEEVYKDIVSWIDKKLKG